MVVLVVVSLAVVGGIAYGIAAAWKEYSNAKSDLASEQRKSQALEGEKSVLNAQLQDASKVPEASEVLPDGKTVTYPLTADNAKIMFWADGEMVAISDKRVMAYVASLPGETRQKVCGLSDTVSFPQTSVAMGRFDTGAKEFRPNQSANCLEMMASETLNSDETSRTEAQQLLDRVKANIEQFVKDASIK